MLRAIFPHFLAQTPAQLVQAKEILDHASAASDRWLFLSAIGIILIGGSVIIKYLVKSLDSQRETNAKAMEVMQKDHAAAMAAQQKLHSEFIEKLYSENVRTLAQVLVALNANNELLSRINKQLEKIEEKG